MEYILAGVYNINYFPMNIEKYQLDIEDGYFESQKRNIQVELIFDSSMVYSITYLCSQVNLVIIK